MRPAGQQPKKAPPSSSDMPKLKNKQKIPDAPSSMPMMKMKKEMPMKQPKGGPGIQSPDSNETRRKKIREYLKGFKDRRLT